jgi:hypothetical protein
MIFKRPYETLLAGRLPLSSLSRINKNLIAAFAFLVLIIIAAPASGENADIPLLVLSLSDTTALTGANDAWISVYLANYQDTIAGFQLWVILDRPDLVEFDTESGAFDTAGTLISGWQYVEAVSVANGHHDIKITARAVNTPEPPYENGLTPTSYGGLLLRLKVRTYESIPDDTIDARVRFHVADNPDETFFYDPSGDLIGAELTAGYRICDTLYLSCTEWSGIDCLYWMPTDPASADTMIVDTFFRYWVCEEWEEDSCLTWFSSTDDSLIETADSVSIDSLPYFIFDTTSVFFADGSMEVMDFPNCCVVPGDANSDESVNVGDVVFMISYIFKSGPPPPCPWAVDCNGDCQIDVADVVCRLCIIFMGCPPKECAPEDCEYPEY